MKKQCLAFAALLLAGCQTHQGYPPPQPVTPPVSPHPVPPHPPRQPLPPVRSAGPLTRAGVETYMDAQEADLRSYLRGQGVLVARRGNGLAITVASDRLFDRNGVSAWGDAFLQSVGQVLAHYDHSAVEVNGYSNSGASDDQAVALSQSRAKAIADGLSRYGVAPARITATGFGTANLRIANASDPRNRRIEIRVTPKPQ